MTEQERVAKILSLLNEHYTTEYKCYLNHETPWQLLIAVIMSAQCPDERVNIVTKDLFVKYKTLEDFANAKQSELEKDIHSIGFYRNKAKNIILTASCGFDSTKQITKKQGFIYLASKLAFVVLIEEIRILLIAPQSCNRIFTISSVKISDFCISSSQYSVS